MNSKLTESAIAAVAENVSPVSVDIERLDKQATIALIVAIVCSLGFAPIGTVGIWLGGRANRELQQRGLQKSTKATTAIIVGYLAGFFTLALLAFSAMVVAFFIFPPFQDAVMTMDRLVNYR